MAGEYHSLKKQQYLNLIKECAHSGKNKREWCSEKGIANHGLSSPPARSFRATCTRKQGHRHGLKATSRFTRDITPR